MKSALSTPQINTTVGSIIWHLNY